MIKITRSFYVGTFYTDKNWKRTAFHPVFYKSQKAAAEEITALDDGIYYLDHGEIGRPDYSIIPLRKLSDEDFQALLAEHLEYRWIYELN